MHHWYILMTVRTQDLLNLPVCEMLLLLLLLQLLLLPATMMWTRWVVLPQ